MAQAILAISFVLLLCGCARGLSQAPSNPSQPPKQTTKPLNPPHHQSFKIEEIPENPEVIIFEE